MNDRIQLILKTKNISASKFADEIGVQRSSISHILSGRNNPSLDFIQKILKRFPDISSGWILTGKGGMYIEPDLFSVLEEPKQEKNKIVEKIEEAKEDEIVDNQGIDIDEVNVVNDLKQYSSQSKQSKQKESIKKTSQILINDKEEKSQEIFKKVQGRKIERIIIFYSDKSCIEYIPE